MNNVCLTGKLETEPEIVTKNGKGQFFYFKLRVMNETSNGYIRINCVVYGDLCVNFYSRCKLNDFISVNGSIIPSIQKFGKITVHSYNVMVNKFEVISSAPANFKPKNDIKDEYV